MGVAPPGDLQGGEPGEPGSTFGIFLREPPPPPPQELDFASFVQVALSRADDLSPELDREAAALVMSLHRAASAVVYDLEAAVHRPSGWSWAGFRLLFALWIAGPLLSKDAARIAGMSRQATSSLANTLERDALVSRTPDGRDGRAVSLALTDKGRAAIAATYSRHNARERMWADRLTPHEREVLVGALGKLLDGVDDPQVRRRD